MRVPPHVGGIDSAVMCGRRAGALRPAKRVVLADIDGPGIVRHIWMTFPPARPERMRALYLEVFYDGGSKLKGTTFVDPNGSPPYILFGEASLFATGISDWDYVTHNAFQCAQ